MFIYIYFACALIREAFDFLQFLEWYRHNSHEVIKQTLSKCIKIITQKAGGDENK